MDIDILDILNQANVEIINVSKIEKKLKNVKSIKEKIEHFVLEIMLTELEENVIKGIVSENKEIEQILKETILEKNRKTKEKYPMYDNSKEKISYIAGLKHAMRLIDMTLNDANKECDIQNQLNELFHFEMELEPDELFVRQIIKMLHSEKNIQKQYLKNEDAIIEFEEL
jgi:hypothetical protein